MKKFISVLILAVIAALVSCHGADAMTTTEFYRLARKHKHIQPFAVTVQSACETGHWTSELWTNGYNGAGLKVSKEWLSADKPYISKNSIESNSGVYGQETSKFRKYKSPGEFLRDYEKRSGKTIPDLRGTEIIYGVILQGFMPAERANGRQTTNTMKN